jgi:hypothetical protein
VISLGLILAAQAPLFLWIRSAFAPASQVAVAISVVDSVFLAALGLSITFYRLLFHPLRKYPGPVLARLTKIWFAFVCRDGKVFRVIQALHKQYGDVVRIGTYFCPHVVLQT